MSTLRKILDKKQNGEIKVEEEKVYKSELLGEDIIVRKRPLSDFLEIISGLEGENEDMVLNYLIHAYCPMFQDPDGVKETIEYYEQEKNIKIGSPRELPELIFESSMKEMSELAELITSFYDMDGLGMDIKN